MTNMENMEKYGTYCSTWRSVQQLWGMKMVKMGIAGEIWRFRKANDGI